MQKEKNSKNNYYIREISVADAADFLGLCRQLDAETTFMLLEPGERKTTLRQQEEQIRAIKDRRNHNVLVAVAGETLVGYAAATGGNYRRNWHKAKVVVGLLQAFTGRGLGTKLLRKLIEWARQEKLHKLELTVMVHNKRAIALYRKMGFVVEGVSVDSLRVDGQYVDELDMAKIIGM